MQDRSSESSQYRIDTYDNTSRKIQQDFLHQEVFDSEDAIKPSKLNFKDDLQARSSKNNSIGLMAVKQKSKQIILNISNRFKQKEDHSESIGKQQPNQ